MATGGDAETPPLEGWLVNVGKAPAPTVAWQLMVPSDNGLPTTEPGLAMEESADMSRR